MTFPAPALPQAEYWNGPASMLWVELQERLDVLFAPLTSVALDAARPQPGERVLDVGCGCGATVLELARRVGPQGKVTGVDVSVPMLARARQRVDAAGLANVTLTVADAGAHAFVPASVDLVFSRLGSMFFGDPVAAFANLRDALRPGGRIVLVCPRAAAQNRYISEAVQAARPLLPAGALVAQRPDEPGMFSLADPERVRRILGAAGIDDVALQPCDGAMQLGASAADAAAFSIQFGPLPRILTSAGEDLQRAVLAAVTARYRELEGPTGVALEGAFWIVSGRRA